MSKPSGKPTQPTRLQRFLGSRLVTGAGMALSRYAPVWMGHAVARLIAEAINTFKPGVYWIVYANLRQVLGKETSEKALHRTVQQVFRHNARNNYDLWHAVAHGPQEIQKGVHIPPEAWANLDRALQRGKGAIIVGTHTGNFDLGILALAARGHEVQVLGLAAPPAKGFTLMDEMRRKSGIRITPASVQAIREAIQRLRSGGIVLTGVDRPMGNATEARVPFFGRPALLPTGHVRLALKTDAAILVASPSYHPDQRRTVVNISPPLVMERTGDPEKDLKLNLQRVTEWVERSIRHQPGQWALFLPVWPDENSR